MREEAETVLYLERRKVEYQAPISNFVERSMYWLGILAPSLHDHCKFIKSYPGLLDM